MTKIFVNLSEDINNLISTRTYKVLHLTMLLSKQLIGTSYNLFNVYYMMTKEIHFNLKGNCSGKKIIFLFLLVAVMLRKKNQIFYMAL